MAIARLARRTRLPLDGNAATIALVAAAVFIGGTQALLWLSR